MSTYIPWFSVPFLFSLLFLFLLLLLHYLNSMSKENSTRSLSSWLQNIKHHHDKRPSVTIVTPDEQKYVVSDPVIMEEHEHQDEPIVVANVEPPVAARASADANSVHDDDKASTKSKPASIFSMNGAARKLKNNLIHFHRPHGLLFQNQAKPTDHDHQHRESEEDKQRQSSENSTDSHASSCACCNSNNTSNNDADDEYEEPEQADNDSVRSKDWTKHPPCLCNTHISEAVDEGDDGNDGDGGDGASVHGHKDVSRDNSVFSLPEDIDKPEVGFKKLRKDGDMIDWDELSTFMEERDEDYDETNQPLVEYAKSRLFTRSVIRNDLVRLALNG